MKKFDKSILVLLVIYQNMQIYTKIISANSYIP